MFSFYFFFTTSSEKCGFYLWGIVNYCKKAGIQQSFILVMSSFQVGCSKS